MYKIGIFFSSLALSFLLVPEEKNIADCTLNLRGMILD